MFKFSTTTVLNSFTDDNGIAKLVATGTDGAGTLTIHRLGKFTADSTQAIYKRVGTNGSAGTATVTCAASNVPSSGSTAAKAGIYRLKIYVKLSGNNDAYYANDYVFKGKPYVYEFSVTGADSAVTGAVIAAKAKEAIDHLASRFNDKVFKVTVSGADLTLETIGEDKVYRNITECTLQKFDATINSALVGGEYVDVATGSMVACVNPFGNYTEIIKDLRLPTPEHTGWTNPYKDEMPVLGTVYNQYIIYMCKDRGIMGGSAVGMPVKSVTAHSIWVPQGAMTTEFETALAKIGTPVDYRAEYEAAANAVKGTDGKLGTADDDFAANPGVSGETSVTD